MVGGSGLSMLLLGAIGVFAGVAFANQYSWIFIILGALVGGAIGVFAGALGWEFVDEFGSKCLDAYVKRQYLFAAFWLVMSIATLLLSYGGMVWLLMMASSR
jgi:hypothetical protein